VLLLGREKESHAAPLCSTAAFQLCRTQQLLLVRLLHGGVPACIAGQLRMHVSFAALASCTLAYLLGGAHRTLPLLL
jgi:hypothetical protein